MNCRGFLLIAAIVMAMFTIPAMHMVNADCIIFTESDTHHVPWVSWPLDPPILPSDPFACGYHSTTPSEEAQHFKGGIHPSCMWGVEATRVTVSFPDTPDASVIGADNWLAVGMFVQGQDESVRYQD